MGGARQVDAVVAAIGDRLDGSPLAVLLDVDGTLAPIAPRPADAHVPAAMREALRRVIDLPGVALALVSGRSVEDAWRVAGIAGAWVIGNHGFELRTPDGQASALADVRPYESAVAEAARLLTSGPAVPGALLENKRWTLSLHYRLVDPQQAPALIAHARGVAADLGLRVTEGKKVVELRPPLDVNKGTASVALAQQLGALAHNASAVYAGDDRTDEDAFRALRSHGPRPVTARVMAGGEDRAHEPTDAEFSLASPDELRLLLEWLAARRARGSA